MTEGKASTPQKFWNAANQFGFTFNWAYASRKNTAYFTSGRLPRRAAGARPPPADARQRQLRVARIPPRGRAPARRRRPQRAAAELEQPLGAGLHARRRRALRIGAPRRAVRPLPVLREARRTWSSVMNRAATEDVRSPVWPVISRCCARRRRPTARDRKIVNLLDDWVSRDAPRLDADNDGLYDEPSPAIMDALFKPLAQTVLHKSAGRPGRRRRRRARPGRALRRVVRRQGPAHPARRRRQGTLQPALLRRRLACTHCSSWLWFTLHVVADRLAEQFGNPDPAKWLATASRTGFQPGLIPNTFRATNRPTFQQVLEFQGAP